MIELVDEFGPWNLLFGAGHDEKVVIMKQPGRQKCIGLRG
jgi:hypothetical protein